MDDQIRPLTVSETTYLAELFTIAEIQLDCVIQHGLFTHFVALESLLITTAAEDGEDCHVNSSKPGRRALSRHELTYLRELSTLAAAETTKYLDVGNNVASFLDKEMKRIIGAAEKNLTTKTFRLRHGMETECSY